MNANNDDISNRLRASLGAADAPTLGADIVTGAAERPAPHLVNRGRRAVVTGGLTLVAAAAVTTALVVTSPFQQAPLFTAAGGPGGNQEMSAAADSRMMVWTNYEYVPGSGLSTDTGSGHVYQLQRTGKPTEVAAAAAAALGVTGEAAESSYSTAEFPTYVVGPEDGSAPSVTVSWSGTGDWWYNDPAGYPQTYTCDDAGVCTELPVTENLAPSESDARAKAADIFAATGFDVDADDIRVTADDWQTVASASLVVDGTQTALEWTVVWGSTGLISSASGHSVVVVDKGSYGTVSAKDAVDRLADWRWFGAAGPEYQNGMNLMAASDLARTEDAPTTDIPATEAPSVEPTDGATTLPAEPVDPTVPTDPVPTDPMPEPTLVDPVPMPLPTPETVVVTVDEAHKTLLLTWDADGNAWLVPGFAMPHPDGWFNSVISLVEGVITLPEPVAIEPLNGEIAY